MQVGLTIVNGSAKNGRARRRAGIAKASLASLVLVLALMSAATSVAFAAPKGIFARYAQCPASAPYMALCMHAEITGGTFAVGKLSIPIARPIVIQDGAASTPGETINQYLLSPPTNGESIPVNELTIPGGLQGILKCPQAGCRGPSGNIEPNAVYASIESAASSTDPGKLNIAAAIFGEGTMLTLPIRVQLRNSLLGNACYLGSVAHPIELRLTTGTTSPPPPNKPITGTLGQGSENIENGYSSYPYTGGRLVDNSFTVPVAQGCGERLSSVIDLVIDQELGLESKAGHNTAILLSSVQLAEVGSVLASEAFPGK